MPFIPLGNLIPVEEESYYHTARVCVVSKADNKLYVSLGQPFNVAPADKLDLYQEVGIGGMIRFNRFPGSLDREVVATGIRNSVGHALLEKMEVEIGGLVIDKQYGNWMNLWVELSHNKDKYDQLKINYKGIIFISIFVLFILVL